MNLESSKYYQYALNVVGGKVIAGKLTILACKRYLNDLKTAKKRGWIFDQDRADQAINFIQNLKLTEGEWSGRDLILEPWQQFIVANLFGWVDKNGNRRFRKVYEEVARKNAKSTKVAAILLKLFFAENEPRSQVYSLATKLDQALYIFDAAVAQVGASEILSDPAIGKAYNSKNNHRIVNVQTGGVFRPLEWNPKKQDGSNPFAVGIDEYHAHENDDAVAVMETGMGSRKNPVSYKVTTAGYNKSGPCYKYRDYIIQILNGTIQDDRTFGIIYTLDDDDDWMDQRTWIKANPNLNVSVYMDFLISEFNQAVQSPRREVDFKTKNLNLWVDSAVTWIPDHVWMANQTTFHESELAGMQCCGGLDLAQKNDFCALCLKFPMPSGTYRNVYRFYIPQSSVGQRRDGVGDNMRQWIRDGFIVATPGNATDHEYIRRDINQLSTQFQIQEILYDPRMATQLVIDLIKDGHNMSGFSQAITSMSAPTSHLDKIVKDGKNQHNNNPVQRWMIGNVLLLDRKSVV